MTQGDRPKAVAYRAGLHLNGDWRGGKHGIYQGGFRVPMMVRWPGYSPPGVNSNETINLVDLPATIAAAVGSALPPAAEAAEDSFNVLPAFLGRKLAENRGYLVSHSADGVFAIRQGSWKYVEDKPAKPVSDVPGARKDELSPQLYNLHNDPAEQKNLISTRLAMSSRLLDLLSTVRAKRHTR